MSANAGLVLSALLVSIYPLEVLRLVALAWSVAALFLLTFALVAVVARSFILPFTNPDLYRLITSDTSR